MRLHLIFVGKTVFPELQIGIQRYLDRLGHYIPTEVHVVKAERITPKIGEETVKEREGASILKLVGHQDYLVVWDQRGRQLDSVSFAYYLEGLMTKGISNLWMVIGGPLGTSPALVDRADSLLTMSKMTFPHDMARLVVAEQLYRAFTILRREPYHK